MKLFAKLMLALLVIAMLLPFTVLKDDSGKPLLSFSNLSLPDFSLPDFGKVEKLAPGGGLGASNEVLFYRWYDAEGNVQFSNEPPPAGIEYTVKGYDPEANVIQAVKPEATTDAPRPAAESDAEQESGKIANPYSPESIEKLFEDAKNVEKLLNQRFEQQEQVLNQ